MEEPAESSDTQAATRTWLVQELSHAHREFDKTVTALATGALVLSVTFLEKIAPSRPVESGVLLAISWGCFSAALLSTLLSFATSQRALFHRIAEIDTDQGPEKANNANKWTTWLNGGAAGFLCFGVVFLAWFAYANLEKG